MSYSATALRAVQTGIELAIPHEMSTPEWAETYRGVGRGSRKGKWLNSTVPFLTEIMAAADDPYVREIIVQASRQVGKSSCAENIIGKRIHQNPTEIAYVAEKEDKARYWTVEAFDTMVRETPELRQLIADTPEGNNQKVKRFPGGSLYILHASSPAELSSRPFQIVIYDEKAAYQPTREGDAVKIGEGSTKTYDGEELIMKISTPRRCDCAEGETCVDISHDYERGDQREYYVPCPHCDEFQTLKFGGKDTPFGLKWDTDSPEAPYYLCEHCQCIIEEFDRDEMLAKGYWRASKPFRGVASFRISQIYSPFVQWGRMVVDFLESKSNIAQLEVFSNTVLGEVWKPVQRIEYEDMAWKLETYAADVPPGVLVLTAGVDIQKNRIEAEVVGWGAGNESWSIDYRVFEGDTGIEISNDGDEILDGDEPLTSVWNDLADFLAQPFAGVDGQTFRVQTACIDSGYQTTLVYRFVHKHAKKRWFAIKGMSDPYKPIVSKPTMTKTKPRVRLFGIGTNAGKDEVFSALQTVNRGQNYCHFPDKDRFDEAHFKQLCSEKMTTHTRAGRTYRIYEPVGKGVRNEALDCRVYATAARVILNPNYDAIARRRLVHTESVDREDVAASSTQGENMSIETQNANTSPPKNNVVPIRGRSLTKNNPFAGYKP